MAAAVAIVLGLLALLHVYWAVGGVAARSLGVPEVSGKPAFKPTRLATLAVAAALALAALLLLFRGGLLSSPLPPVLGNTGVFAVAAAFLLRAVGDFRLVGFFKRVRGTPFAAWDTRLFSPLSLGIGLASLWVALS